MDFIKVLADLLKQYGPAIGVLIISYLRDQRDVAKHQTDIADLERKFLEHKIEIEKKYAGKSSADVVVEFSEPGTGSKPE